MPSMIAKNPTKVSSKPSLRVLVLKRNFTASQLDKCEGALAMFESTHKEHIMKTMHKYEDSYFKLTNDIKAIAY